MGGFVRVGWTGEGSGQPASSSYHGTFRAPHLTKAQREMRHGQMLPFDGVDSHGLVEAFRCYLACIRKERLLTLILIPHDLCYQNLAGFSVGTGASGELDSCPKQIVIFLNGLTSA